MSLKGTTDAIGNKLRIGQLVRLSLKEPYVIGKIANVEDGGLLTPSAGALQHGLKMPGKIEIKFEITLHFNPGAAVAALLCLVDPETEKISAGDLVGTPADS